MILRDNYISNHINVTRCVRGFIDDRLSPLTQLAFARAGLTSYVLTWPRDQAY